ncbi:MAG: winged helix-turn-helix transcriptional regulator [Clostridia bacterium]|nr:winged helix-turn-helix transcriptional regulator [Clostridia bacterium]
MKWICGFANAQGGRLYIGCDDTGKVIGVEKSKKLLEDIPNTVKNTLAILVDVNLLTDDGKDYIEIIVPSYSVPISYNGVYYRRSGATNQTLEGRDLDSFLLGKGGVTGDASPLPSFTVDDVDDAALEYFKKMAIKKGRLDSDSLDEPKEMVLQRLSLFKGSYLTNAAMLLFSRDPEKWVQGAYVKVAYFEGPDIIYQDEVHGSIIEQVEKTKELVYYKYLKAKITYEGLYRRERYFVPEDAFREALINAICHKPYESLIPIQVSVYDDKVYIGNIAYLPEEMTLERLMGKHMSMPYNPKIAQVFYLAGLIESWGRGIEKISNICEEDGVYPPEYTTASGKDIMVKFSAPVERLVRLVPVNPDDRRNYQLDDISCKILALLSEDPGCSRTMISQKMSLSVSTVARYVRQLKEKGFIERVGSDKKGYWNIVKNSVDHTS